MAKTSANITQLAPAEVAAIIDIWRDCLEVFYVEKIKAENPN